MNDIIGFWFNEITRPFWWKKNPDFDQEIKNRFAPILHQAAMCELYTWRTTAEGRLAEIIVLDQFSRNIFRDSANAFSQDSTALALAQEAIQLGCDQALPPEQKGFLYMPFMHSESKSIHEVACQLFNKSELEEQYQFELKHKVIIDRFGRYPHRNAILGRTSTDEEVEFLKQPGSKF